MTEVVARAASLAELLSVRVAYPADVSATHVLVQANLTGTMQLYRVPLEGGELEQLTNEREPVAGWFVPGSEQILVSMDHGGNERGQLHLRASDGTLAPLVVDPRFIHTSPRLSRDGRLLAYSTNRRNGVDFDIVVRNLETGEESIVFDRGGLCEAAAFAPDGRSLVVERLTERPGDNDLWLVGVDGAVELLTPHGDEAFFGSPVWVAGRLHYVTNSGRDRQALVRHGDGVVLEGEWDLCCVADAAGATLLVAANEDGYTRFELRDGATLELLGAVPLPGRGVADDEHLPLPRFTPDGRTLVYGFTSAIEPGDVFAYSLDTGETRRLTRTHDDRSGLVEPRLERVVSFDGEHIPVYLYETDPKAPVVIDIHGGPESQERPIWNPLIQWFVANGYAVAAPNVRGSTGYGRRFEHLDDVELRLDSVRDLVALHEALGGERQAILWGGSYGGYMVLAGLAFFPERWTAGVDIVGISSLVTFLENTSPYRRAFREREYGSLEHHRAFLESVSPLSRVDAIRAPLFVIHGANDPRVPLSEAEQLVASLTARGIPCELAVYGDEGHGLKRLENRLDAYPRAIAFIDSVVTQ